MYPFYNTNQRLFPFPFFPFPGTGFNRRRRLNRISGIPGTSMLRNALAEDVQAGDLKMTIRYMIYYNKCTKTYQLVNSYLANIPTATA